MALKFAKKDDRKKILKDNWSLLIVDDEAEVHTLTKTVLKNFEFKNKGLSFFSAYCGKEAVEIVKNNPNIDVALFDVVMDGKDDDGLNAIKIIRNDLKNKDIRIILRTGQPGIAPEKDVILNYDIDDYKEKTELTSTKLFTTIVSSLRTISYIRNIKRHQYQMQQLAKSSTVIFGKNSIESFCDAILKEINIIFQNKNFNALIATMIDNEFHIVTSNGKYKNISIIPAEIILLFNKTFINKSPVIDKNIYATYYKSKDEKVIFLYLENKNDLDDEQTRVVEILNNNISLAFDNLCLNNELLITQKEIIEKLGAVVEGRSFDTAKHVKRVAQISYILAKAKGLSEKEALKLKLASPMHDIGKVAIADNILLKPSRLNEEEFDIMKTHTTIGFDILKGSKRELLQLCQTIAYEHHERWDGKGYPRGISGNNISLYGRITAIADVFDALKNKRVYKDSWSTEKILEYFKEQRGKQFDPELVDILLENIDEIKKIYDD